MRKKTAREMICEEKYKDALTFYHKAEDALKGGDFDVSLFQIRKALENIVRRMCERHAINVKDPTTGKSVDLLTLIDQLGSQSIISEDDVHLLHQIRSLGNKGVHNDVPSTRGQAQMAINKFSQALTVFKRVEIKEAEKAEILAKTEFSRKDLHFIKKEARKKVQRKEEVSDLKFFIGLVVTFILSGLCLYYTLKYGFFGGSDDFAVIFGSFGLSCLLSIVVLFSGFGSIVLIFVGISEFVLKRIPFVKNHARKKRGSK